MNKSLIHRLTFSCILIASFAALSGCGGGNNPGTSRNYTIGGSVRGLDSGESVGLLENNGDALTVSTNGTFVFANALVGGAPYEVTVGTQPSGQTCTVSGGLGTVGTADVTSVAVSCRNNTYAIGGSVTGLTSGESVGLLENNGNALTVSTDGAFVFTNALAHGSPYAVTVGIQPVGQSCTVSGGLGTVGTADVTSVVVSCTNNPYTIGGTITGLSDSGLVLANGSDTLKVAANATSFTMPTAVTNGTAYDVTVRANPPALNCTVASGAGTVAAADVTSVGVSCVAGTESILYSFTNGADGGTPMGSLIQASDGNFYGMTQEAGASNQGVVFEITPGGTETVLHTFTGGTDGALPNGSLIQASDGNFYGMHDPGRRCERLRRRLRDHPQRHRDRPALLHRRGGRRYSHGQPHPGERRQLLRHDPAGRCERRRRRLRDHPQRHRDRPHPLLSDAPQAGNSKAPDAHGAIWRGFRDAVARRRADQ